MKICLECAEGGHLDEMLSLMDAFEGHDIFFITTIAESTKDLPKLAKVYYVRNQKTYKATNRFLLQAQLFLFELYCLIKLLFVCLNILLNEKPKIIVTIGGGATIPLCYIGKALGTKIIYISSLARVDELPFTGKIIYPIADLFLVQWEYLLPKHQKAQYWGKVI